MSQPDWDRANCIGSDTELFFPVSGNADCYAKLICSRCSIREACLDWAIERPEKFGVWGGMNETDRTEEVRRRNKAARIAAGIELAQKRFARAMNMRTAGLTAQEIADEMRVDIRTVQRYIRLGAS